MKQRDKDKLPIFSYQIQTKPQMSSDQRQRCFLWNVSNEKGMSGFQSHLVLFQKHYMDLFPFFSEKWTAKMIDTAAFLLKPFQVRDVPW